MRKTDSQAYNILMSKCISQIFLSDFSTELPEFLVRTTSSVKLQFKDYKHKIYNLEELRTFIKANYPSKVLWAFDTLRPYSYKSDLGRFCLLYKLGGWYFDIAIECLFQPKIDEDLDMLCFRDEQRHSLTSWAVAGGIIWSKAQNNIFSTAIDSIVRNCDEQWYGRTPLCPTGPALFGESIATQNRGKKILFGYLDRPMIPFTKKNFPYLKRYVKANFRLPDDKAFSLVKPAQGGDLKSLGVDGSNNYNQFWKSNSVYKSINFYEGYE